MLSRVPSVSKGQSKLSHGARDSISPLMRLSSVPMRFILSSSAIRFSATLRYFSRLCLFRNSESATSGFADSSGLFAGAYVLSTPIACCKSAFSALRSETPLDSRLKY